MCLGLHGLDGAPQTQRLDRLTAVVRELEAAAGRDVALSAGAGFRVMTTGALIATGIHTGPRHPVRQ
ncbi:hypothetical protein RB200_35095 [Streptomyces sp. PmtG]